MSDEFPEVELPWEMTEACYLWLLPTLEFEIRVDDEKNGANSLPKAVTEDLDSILEIAVDGAAYEGDWDCLVRLRQCLLKWADEAESALQQIAEKGPGKDEKPE